MDQKILDSYIRLEHNVPELSQIVNVNWCMGNTCNFACSYCPDGLHNATIGWYDFGHVKAFCERTIQHYAGKTIYFEFTGGEVTLWKYFPDLCKFLKERGCKVGFISNSSRTLRWWNDIIPHVDHVCLSFHPEFGDKAHFTEVVKITSVAFRTHVNLMMHPDMFDDLFEFAQQLSKIDNISMALQPLLEDFGEKIYPYSEEHQAKMHNQHDLIIKHIKHTKQFETYRGAMAMITPEGRRIAQAAHKFISTERNSWTGWNCHAGLEQIVVDLDGKIFRGWCRVGGSIGHVLDADLNLPTQTITCNKSRCHCNFDIMCTKEKTNA